VIENFSESLSAFRVVVTRPEAQAERLCKDLADRGSEVLRYPALRIAPPLDLSALRRALERLARYQLAVFVSTNAVAAVLAELGMSVRWPESVAIAAIGERTAQALSAAGLPPRIVPSVNFDSETLLAEPSLQQMQGQHVIIFRGSGGRDLIAKTLRARGAEVDYAECYRRLGPEWLPTEFLEQLTASRPAHQLASQPVRLPILPRHRVIMLTSGEGYQFFREHLGNERWAVVTDTSTLIAGGQRLAGIIRDSVPTARVIAAADPTDSAMLLALSKLCR